MTEFSVVRGDLVGIDADALIVNLFEGVIEPAGGAGAVDQALNRAIGKELAAGRVFHGKLGDTCVFPTYGALKTPYVVMVGLGKQAQFNGAAIRRAAAAAIRACQKLRARSVATILHGAGAGGFDAGRAARLLAEGTLMGAYQFLRYKTPQRGDLPRVEIERVAIVERDAAKIAEIEAGLGVGAITGRAVRRARDWVSDSANAITPDAMRQLAEGLSGVSCQVLSRADLEKSGMGAFLSVAKGSDAPPYLVHLSITPPASVKSTKTVALVGKGITFDSGGLSLKPPAGQELMKMDMAGAAAVLASMGALGELAQAGLPLNCRVDGFLPLCENMPGPGASKPGDIVRAMSGKTIEINNTDAEGRLILADAITYAQKTVSPDEIIDLATLTGACITALGEAAAGIMGSNQPLIDALRASGEAAGEKLWQLPLYEEYEEALKSDVADLINAGSKGKAGTACAAMFLKHFIEGDRAWAHLDIAGPAWTSADRPETPKGASGFGVRTLLYYLYGWQS
ncbi:MAG: leucyl aminopeptidase [Vampirovibrionales bacterium]|nr:leucyl aminopeptidase [Vampirovibrionales bacterium]